MAQITLGSNIASLKAQRQLGRASDTSARAFERLASGQRINHASDDAAGLAIASDLTARTRVYSQAARNINDGVSVLSIADSTVNELSNIVVRLRELAEQSANGTYSDKQRSAIDLEAQTLAKEFTRVSRSTAFNGLNLFDGTLANGLRLQLGYGVDGGISSTLGGSLGTGTFGSAGTFSGGDPSFAIATGDLNGDGILDIATAGYGVPGGFATIMLGRGDGTFAVSATYATDNFSQDIVLGDVNGDGALDLVTSGYGPAGGNVTVRLNRGDGTFGSARSYQAADTSNATIAISLGDLNGDGKLDIVESGYNGNDMRVRLGRGDGTFGAFTGYSMSGYVEGDNDLGDLNGDGILDVVTASLAGGEELNIRLGRGDGTFGARTFYTGDTSGSTSVKLVDLNGDNKLDIVSAGGGAGNIGSVSVRLGNGNGTFGASVSFTAGLQTVRDLSLGDFNGDGQVDLITGGNGEVDILLGRGNGTFAAAVSYQAANTVEYGVTNGDFNGDGVLDIVSSGYSNVAVPSVLSVRLGNTRDGISPILPFSLKTRADSLQSIGMLDRALSNLAKQRGTIGAFESRLTTALSTIYSSRENYSAAASRVMDADIASESATLTRTEIQKQAAVAVLAQANQLPSLALSLLR